MIQKVAGKTITFWYMRTEKVKTKANNLLNNFEPEMRESTMQLQGQPKI